MYSRQGDDPGFSGLPAMFVQSIPVWPRVVYKSRQPANFAGFSARSRRLLSLLHEPRYVEEMMFIRSKLLGLNK